jgi:steroid delta-isomerase-like uncharacterized protein
MSRLTALALVTLLAGCRGPHIDASRTPEAIVRAYIDAWNRGDSSALDTLLATAVVHEDVAQRVRAEGVDQVKAFMAKSRQFMPDLHLEVTSVFTDGSNVAAEWRLTATIAGGSRSGSISNARIQNRGASIAVIEAGRIRSFTDYYDER